MGRYRSKGFIDLQPLKFIIDVIVLGFKLAVFYIIASL